MLPRTNEVGDLPPGVYPVTLDELIERFSSGSEQRRLVTGRLLHIHNLARRTGHLDRMVVFVSYWQIKRDGSKRGIVEVMTE